VDFKSKQAKSIPQCQLSTTVLSRRLETIAEQTLHVATNNSPTGVLNDYDYIKKSKSLKTDLNEYHKSSSAD